MCVFLSALCFAAWCALPIHKAGVQTVQATAQISHITYVLKVARATTPSLGFIPLRRLLSPSAKLYLYLFVVDGRV